MNAADAAAIARSTRRSRSASRSALRAGRAPAAVVARHRAPEDASLPRLAELFDLELVSRRLGAHFACAAPTPWQVLGCEIERVKYRPGRNCVVAYVVRVRRAPAAATRRIRVCVAVHTAGEGPRRLEAARRAWAAGASDFGPAAAWLDEPGAMLWLFPNDRKLLALPQLADGAWIRESCLPALVRERWGAGWHVQSARMLGVSFFPEHAYTVRAKVWLANGAADRRRVWTVYGKVRDDESGARCHAAMSALLAGEAARAGELGLAVPLAYDAERRILWQEGVPAPTLDRVQSTAGARVPWHRIGLAVAGLHRTPLGLPVRLDLAATLVELERARERVSLACPEHAPALGELVDALVARAADVDDTARGTLHGDLHSRNVLVGADRVFLIDLDRIATGSPLADLGSLLAEIAFRDCLAGRAASDEPCRALLNGYRQHVPWFVDARSLAWHTAAALVRERAYRCVGSLKPGRLAALPRVLVAATRVLAHGVPGWPLAAASSVRPGAALSPLHAREGG